ncbi:MAG: hypothetical protein JNN07_18505 [Verrucomicrobiales bacterium]|nr:hypothetical protein [Verrucomicrobiales bacterium]
MRQGNVALYERKLLASGARPHWELVRIKTLKASVIHGKEYPRREVYPKDEDWGTLGWTLVSLDDAKERFAALVASYQKPKLTPTLDPLYSTLSLGKVNTADSACDALVKEGGKE